MADITSEEMSLTEKVGRMARLMHRFVKKNAQTHGTKDTLQGQGRVLAMIATKPDITQKELCFLLDMRPKAVAELLRKLEEKGYLIREKSEEDGRVTSIHLTEEGSDAVPNIDEMDTTEQVFTALTEDELVRFENMVDTLIADLKDKLVAMGDDPDALEQKPQAKHIEHTNRRERSFSARDRGFRPRHSNHDGRRGSFHSNRSDYHRDR